MSSSTAEPLLVPPAPASTPAAAAVPTRIAALLLFSSLALWANHEASKGFAVTVLRSSSTSPAARRFNLLFVSNGRAERAVIAAAASIDRVLFPDALYPRKPINRVTVCMAESDLSGAVSVTPGDAPAEFTIYLSPTLMAGPDAGSAVAAAVRLGVARALLWDGQGTAPRALLDAAAEYLAGSGGAEGELLAVVRFLECCEGRRAGFVARLNLGMREGWSAGAVDEALGEPARSVCERDRRPARARRGQRAGSTSAAGLRHII